MAITEEQLISWSKPVSDSEDQKCQNAITQVTTAIRNKFGNKVTIFLQGSYRNNTNVRRNSDVDIVVRYDQAYYPDLQRLSSAEVAEYNANSTNAGYNYSELKQDVIDALVIAFGKAGVERKNKCVNVLGNTNRINADVIPCFVLKRFKTVTTIEAEGIKFYSDAGDEIISFPEQHYENGVEKTQNTGRMYKRVVRILKVINSNLINNGVIQEGLVSSFFIESLVYNISNSNFTVGNYMKTLREVIAVIYKDMVDSKDYTEVSRLKWLFNSGSLRTHKTAMEFMQACWDYMEFR